MNLTVDEQIVPFKGRLSFKQYIKAKPVRFGIKVWAAADSVTSFVTDFSVYTGKASQEHVETTLNQGMSTGVVLKLTEALWNRGYRVYTDNFYTSPQLAQALWEKEMHLVGTIRTNRKGWPKEVGYKPEYKASRGDCRFCFLLFEPNSISQFMNIYRWKTTRSMIAMSWMDTNAVNMLSTIHETEEFPLAQYVTRYGSLPIQCPNIVKDYHSYMHGVDLADQLRGSYTTLLPGNKW